MNIVSIRYTLTALSLSILAIAPCNAISFKSVTTWFSNWHEEQVYQEIPFTTAGQLHIKNIAGPIVIKTWSLPKLVVEAKKATKEKDLKNIAVDINITDQKAAVTTVYHDKTLKGTVSYTLMVPEHTNVTIETDEGTIKLKNVHGTINAQTDNGSIDIEHALRSVTAHSKYGPVTVGYTKVPLNARIVLSSDYGTLTLSLPKSVQARITAKTTKGTITSQQPITLAPQTVILNKEYWQRTKRELQGILGNGGAQISLISINGNIKILEQ